MNILIGTDPEIFVRDVEGRYVSGHDLIPGTKAQPFPVMGGAIQVDGTALEFNTNPASTAKEFKDNIASVIAELTKAFQSVRPDLVVTMTPTAVFDQAYFDTLPESAVELGCTPDYNAYTGEENVSPETSEPFRTGAGHIHLGWTKWENPHDEEHFETCRGLVRQLDTVLYPASLLWDSDDKRRTLYGKIGAFRPKSYGVEYRPMSNAYLRSEAVQEFVFETAMKATQDFFDGVIYHSDFTDEVVGEIHAGIVLSSSTIRHHMQYMSDRYGVPEVTF